MDNQLLHDRFIAEVREKIPQKSRMSSTLSEILMIEKEAVYRRLRREVPFTLNEVAKVCQTLGISIDNIIGITTEKSRPFQLKLTEYYEPKEVDYIMMEQFAAFLEQLAGESYSEANSSGNQIPMALWTLYRNITRFHIFYWKYQYDSTDRIVRYGEVKLSDRYLDLCMRHSKGAHNIKNTSFIWDRNLFATLVDEIRFFESINLITVDEKLELKKEIMRFIDDVEMMAARGTWKETPNVVNIYISNIHFDTNYTCYEGGNFYLSMINTFTLNSVASLDESTYDKMKSWLQSSKRVSTLISRSGEMQRILFFAKQREIVNAL